MNLSISKASVPFAKSPRFPTLPHHTRNVNQSTYDKLTDFDKTVSVGKSKEKHAFGSRYGRFNYMSSTDGFAQANSSPGPSNYRIQTHFRENHSTIPNTQRYSMGESRDRSKPEFVQDIIHKSNKLEKSTPGAGRYEPYKILGKEAVSFSIRLSPTKTGKRSDQYDKSYFKNQRGLPGPGSYQFQDVVGSSKLISSVCSTEPQHKFATIKDRFGFPTARDKSPGPGMYTPRMAITNDVASVHPKVPRAKFGNAKRNGLDLTFNMRKAKLNPGPGNYERFSEFHPKSQ